MPPKKCPKREKAIQLVELAKECRIECSSATSSQCPIEKLLEDELFL